MTAEEDGDSGRQVSGGAARVEDPDAILARAAGTLDFTQPEWARRIAPDFPSATLALRSHMAVTRFFDGLELLEPGVVPVNLWRPGPNGPHPPRAFPNWGAVGRKPC